VIPVATRSILVWDLSLRFFHWAFAAALGASLGLALIGGKHSALFSWHMLFGFAAGFLLLLRVVMGLVGSRYARFTRLPVRPALVIGYFRGLFTGGTARYVGHNPGCALAAVAMFLLVPLLIATGLGGSRDPWEEIHGVLAYGLLGIIGLHLLGLLWHRVRHGENIAMSMITGRKLGRPEDGLASSHPVWALGCLLAAGAWIGGLFANHNVAASQVRLPLTGPTIQLSEREAGGKARSKAKRNKHHDD
jgi:cytochrome b